MAPLTPGQATLAGAPHIATLCTAGEIHANLFASSADDGLGAKLRMLFETSRDGVEADDGRRFVKLSLSRLVVVDEESRGQRRGNRLGRVLICGSRDGGSCGCG